MLTIHRARFSTNCHRVALAAAHKGLEIAHVDHEFEGDRAGLVELSGQPLVPVAVFGDGKVLTDSPQILAELERRVPEPALWPADPAGRARARVFAEWFNQVWKIAPNAGDEQGVRDSVPVFEGLLADHDFLLGDEFGIADVIAWPFLRYADPSLRHPDDDYEFHDLCEAGLGSVEAPRMMAWIARVAARPGARRIIAA